ETYDSRRLHYLKAYDSELASSWHDPYEGGKLGAPVSVISRCLTIVADAQASEGALDIGKALEHVKTAADLLEGKSR
ncbi:hypothetical protein DEE93_27575, partial [Ralstonia pickettii]|nr:hypothetical protein [Ralstonia pickettii]MBA9960981.1 hypothetical protein [Ralstonia pickettii]MBA9990609.1 hypothetical protein [Ralstonia pickettii]MBX3757296.1 hypothetical protein [Ralstonia pickettii]MBX3786098.1 hypothetical protein [Ralstonia pickettii]